MPSVEYDTWREEDEYREALTTALAGRAGDNSVVTDAELLPLHSGSYPGRRQALLGDFEEDPSSSTLWKYVIRDHDDNEVVSERIEEHFPFLKTEVGVCFVLWPRIQAVLARACLAIGGASIGSFRFRLVRFREPPGSRSLSWLGFVFSVPVVP